MRNPWITQIQHKNKQYKHFRRIVNRFFRNDHTGMQFQTGKGKSNKIVGCDTAKRSLLIQTENGNAPFEVPIRKVTTAAAVLLYKRTITRKDLGKVFHFNSSLLGLLAHIFCSKVKVFESKERILHLTVLGCLFFFSGMDKASAADWIRLIKNQVRAVLVTYFYLRYFENSIWKYFVEKFGILLIVDSGAYTVYRKQQAIWKHIAKWEQAIEKHGLEHLMESGENALFEEKLKKLLNYEPVMLEKYADFIVRNDAYIYQYVNLDVTGDRECTARNQKLLTELTGRKPIPVWHCNTENWAESDWEALDAIVEEGHSIIGIGATAHYHDEDKKRNVFEEVFKRHPLQNFHALGCSSHLIVEFPFFSADSMGWTKGRTPDDNKEYQVYIMQGDRRSTMRTTLGTKDERLDFNVKMLSSVHDGFHIRAQQVREAGDWYEAYKNMLLDDEPFDSSGIQKEMEEYKTSQRSYKKEKKKRHQLSLWELSDISEAI